MNLDDKILLSDLNLMEYTRETVRWHLAGEIVEQDDLLLTRGGCSFPTTCVAFSLRASSNTCADETFERIQSFYGERQSPFSVHMRRHADQNLEEVCRRNHLMQVSDAPGMVIESPLPEKAVPKGIDIRPVTDIAGISDFTLVTRESYLSLGMPEFVSEQIFATPSRMLKPHLSWVVAYDAGRPVSAAMTLFSHGIAGLYWVGTLMCHRGMGLAESCAGYLINEAFRRGASLVVLQASKFGAPLYQRMGFKEVTRYPWYFFFNA